VKHWEDAGSKFFCVVWVCSAHVLLKLELLTSNMRRRNQNKKKIFEVLGLRDRGRSGNPRSCGPELGGEALKPLFSPQARAVGSSDQRATAPCTAEVRPEAESGRGGKSRVGSPRQHFGGSGADTRGHAITCGRPQRGRWRQQPAARAAWRGNRVPRTARLRRGQA
jgi:hypothetical protein